ncbi:hypothetical protein PT974_05490 [Cladobotryum mycophilum]|uniref:NAD dependent epimerase/dehydratase n=1 Tax=Cladobotryum mycophilum TaxID=491253 RepID=A0ABR0SIX3_9HYPO
MGQQYSAPKEGAEFRVIGAGFPRTGTASFSKALESLLDGPVYHGGTQLTLGPESEVKKWIKLFSPKPPLSPDETTSRGNLKLIKGQLTGYVATTDVPGVCLVPQLLELYPDAKVICTVRDIDSWEKSMEGVSNAATQWFLWFVLFPLPTMRLFPRFVDVMRPHWLHMYGEIEPPTRKSYNGHMEQLKEIVPADRLFFVDVRDGWEPLCKALDVPVPKDIPFPRINDSKAIEDMAKKQLIRGLSSWVAIFAVIGTGIHFSVNKWL